jgi:hypothetical protein
LVENVEESWVVVFLDVILVPQTRFPKTASFRVITEPALRRRIEWRFAVVAQKGDRTPLDIAAQALGPGSIANSYPDKRHATNDPADFAFRVTSPALTALAAVSPLPQVRNSSPSRRISAAPTMSRKMDPLWLLPPVLSWPLCWDNRVQSLVADPAFRACVFCPDDHHSRPNYSYTERTYMLSLPAPEPPARFCHLWRSGSANTPPSPWLSIPNDPSGSFRPSGRAASPMDKLREHLGQ